MTRSEPTIDRAVGMHTRHRALRLAFWSLVVIAAGWLGYESWRLLFQPRPLGAVDLFLRHAECVRWFEGEKIYRTRHDAVYPPASYLMLWPLLGWSSKGLVRVFWLVPTALSVVWICRLFVQHSGVRAAPLRRLLYVVPLASYPVGATVGNGQLSLLVVSSLLGGLMMLAEPQRSWRRDLAIAALVLAALVKPSVSAYFFWILLFVPGGFRPACVVVAAYVALTFGASLAQQQGPIELLEAWMRRATGGVEWGATRGEGGIQSAAPAGGASARTAFVIKSINLHSLLSIAGLRQLISSASFALLALLGAWVFWNRRGHLLCLLGVSAIAARFCSYHGWYDDVMMLIPLAALLACSRAADSARSRRIATGLALALVLFLLAPGGIYALPPTLANTYVVVQAACWLAGLAFLAVMASTLGRPVAST